MKTFSSVDQATFWCKFLRSINRQLNFQKILIYYMIVIGCNKRYFVNLIYAYTKYRSQFYKFKFDQSKYINHINRTLG